MPAASYPVCLHDNMNASPASTDSHLAADRQSLHFYPPLYRLVADEWLAAGEPLIVVARNESALPRAPAAVAVAASFRRGPPDARQVAT